MLIIFWFQTEVTGYPVGICSSCRDMVATTFVLKLKFTETTETLKKYFNNVSLDLIQTTDVTFEKTHKVNIETVIDSNSSMTDFKQETEVISENTSESFDCVTEINIMNDKIKQEDTAATSNNGGQDSDADVSDIEKVNKRNVSVNSRKDYYKFYKHVCPICLRHVDNALALRKHIHSHKTLKKYLKGQKVFENSIFVAKPLKNVSTMMKTEDFHECPICNENLPIEKFKYHIDKHTQDGEEFSCNKCERVFRKISHLNIHKVRAHLEEFPFKCKECSKGFVIKKNYDCHLLTHTLNELPHKCQYCVRSFSNPEHLHRHSFIHTENTTYGIKYKVKKCYACKRSFKKSEELEKHREICKLRSGKRTRCARALDLDDPKFQCSICSKMYCSLEGLDFHTRRKHIDDEDPKIVCTVCGICVSNIYIHMASHEEEKPYKCDLCPKSFATKTVLKQHLIVHSGAKPFVCSSCGKAFNNSYNLVVHERMHKGDKCHKCTVCGKGFLEKSYLNKHMRTHKHM